MSVGGSSTRHDQRERKRHGRPSSVRGRARNLSRPGQSRRQDRRGDRRHPGPRRGDRATLRRTRGRGPRHLRPQRRERRAGGEGDFRDRMSDSLRQGGSRQGRRLPQRHRRGGQAVRPGRRPGQRRRADRPGRHLRHDRGTLQRDLRRQRARAVLSHPGSGLRHAAGEDRRRDRQHPIDVGSWRASRSSPPIAPPRALSRR